MSRKRLTFKKKNLVLFIHAGGVWHGEEVRVSFGLSYDALNSL